MDLRRFGTAGKQPVEERIETLRDIHREPHLPARGADRNRNIENQRNSTITLREPRTMSRNTLAVLTDLASHQRLRLRKSWLHRPGSGSYTVTRCSSPRTTLNDHDHVQRPSPGDNQHELLEPTRLGFILLNDLPTTQELFELSQRHVDRRHSGSSMPDDGCSRDH